MANSGRLDAQVRTALEAAANGSVPPPGNRQNQRHAHAPYAERRTVFEMTGRAAKVHLVAEALAEIESG